MWVLQTLMASCHIREFIKSNKRWKMVKALRSNLKREVVGVDTDIVECLPYLVMLILIAGYIYITCC